MESMYVIVQRSTKPESVIFQEGKLRFREFHGLTQNC